MWEVLNNFGDITEWSRGIKRSALTSDGPAAQGSTRHCDFAPLGAVNKRIDTYIPNRLGRMAKGRRTSTCEEGSAVWPAVFNRRTSASPPTARRVDPGVLPDLRRTTAPATSKHVSVEIRRYACASQPKRWLNSILISGCQGRRCGQPHGQQLCDFYFDHSAKLVAQFRCVFVPVDSHGMHDGSVNDLVLAISGNHDGAIHFTWEFPAVRESTPHRSGSFS